MEEYLLTQAGAAKDRSGDDDNSTRCQSRTSLCYTTVEMYNVVQHLFRYQIQMDSKGLLQHETHLSGNPSY